MFFCLSIDKLSDMAARLLADRGEAGPVIDIDNGDAAVLADDGVAAVDIEVHHLGGAGGQMTELFEVEGGVVDAVQVIPVKQIGIPHRIELHRIAVEMFLEYRLKNI